MSETAITAKQLQKRNTMKISKADKQKYDIHYVECCKEHKMINYRTLHKLSKAQFEEIKLLNQDKEDLQVRLGECVEQVILNNNSWEKKYERMAKLYVGYKRKYASLFKLRETYEKMEEDKPFTEEEKKAAKDYTFKQKETQLESGRIKSQFFLTKKKRKPH